MARDEVSALQSVQRVWLTALGTQRAESDPKFHSDADNVQFREYCVPADFHPASTLRATNHMP